MYLSYGGKDAYVDLGAEHPIGADKNGESIAVEVKSFVGASEMRDLQLALGQFCLYRNMLAEIDPARKLFLAIPSYTFRGLFAQELGQLVVKQNQLKLIVFDEVKERILQWIR